MYWRPKIQENSNFQEHEGRESHTRQMPQGRGLVEPRSTAEHCARGKQIATKAVPICYVEELLDVDAGRERAIRWLIALMVLCCAPRAIALAAAASAPR